MNDLIKRSDAIEELMHIIPYMRYHNGEYVFLLDKRECLTTIKAIPPADRPQGTYTDSNDNVEWYAIEATCNSCGESWMGKRNFCPNCGREMKGVDNGNK